MRETYYEQGLLAYPTKMGWILLNGAVLIKYSNLSLSNAFLLFHAAVFEPVRPAHAQRLLRCEQRRDAKGQRTSTDWRFPGEYDKDAGALNGSSPGSSSGSKLSSV